MKKSILFAALCLVAPSLGAKEFHVAPSPSSEGNGAPDAPFGTLVQARNAVRAYLQSGKDIDKDIKAVVTAAADFAQASEEPDPSELYTDILVEA